MINFGSGCFCCFHAAYAPRRPTAAGEQPNNNTE